MVVLSKTKSAESAIPSQEKFLKLNLKVSTLKSQISKEIKNNVEMLSEEPRDLSRNT